MVGSHVEMTSGCDCRLANAGTAVTDQGDDRVAQLGREPRRLFAECQHEPVAAAGVHVSQPGQQDRQVPGADRGQHLGDDVGTSHLHRCRLDADPFD